MNTRFATSKIVVSALVCLVLVVFCATMAYAQSAGTGAITGTVTDPQGRAVPNATVTATSLETGQSRQSTTGAAGDYKFGLLPPGNYRVRFTAAGFKTGEVASVTVTVTETQTADEAMEVGTVNQTVTIESNVETLQTESSTLGTTVTGSTITALPMANGNYTEVLSLAAGATAGVDNATSLGKGTQDISANGVDPGSNNYQMDGVAVNNIANSGSSNDGTIYTGIPIPSPDAIAEFKIQTSTYDASYGRNPGANVNVVTKSGSNDFHGSAFEYFRNSVLNADDFFYVKTPEAPHQVLDQNQFGATVGGPILKDKLFFFFSYRGTRAKNGVSAAGTTAGVVLPPIPTTRTAASLGAALCNYNGPAFPGSPFLQLACDGSNLSPQGLAIMNIPGLASGGGFYIPSPQVDTQFCHPGPDSAGGFPQYDCNFSIPALYHENQYVANGDYVINSKETLATRYFYTLNPQNPLLGQTGGNLPGVDENIVFGNQDAVLKLTSLVTSNFVNEARASFQRNTDNSSSLMPSGGTNSALGITPGTGGFEEPPVFIDLTQGFTLFGGLLPNFGPTNQLQLADQISWQHGKHSIRAGYEYEWTNWPLLDAGLQQGLMFEIDLNTLLVGTAGNASPFGTGFNQGCLFCVESIPGEQGITHFYDVHNQDAYVLDDWKVNSRLTINAGLRWEYDGLLTDRLGRLTQVYINRMVNNADVPTTLTAALADPAAIQQYVVAHNFSKFFGPPPPGVFTSPSDTSVDGHAPYSNFAPRIGFAWQPLSGGKLVVRGGFGIFYNRVGLDSIVHAFEQGAPYAQTYDYNPGGARYEAATIANPYPALNLVPLQSNPVIGFAPRYADPSTANLPPSMQVSSGLSTPLSYTNGVHTPMVREYSLGIQYEFIHGWVLDMGYVGSSGINLNDYNHNQNGALLFSPCNPVGSKCATDPYGLCQLISGAPICNTANNAQFRVPVLGYEAAGLAASDSNGYSNYNSLQVTVRHQFSHGLSMQAAYTWDKDLSDIFYSNSANINNSLCLKCQYGRVSFDRPQRLSVNYSYDLPFGKGTEGITNKLVAGWNVSGVTIAQSGDPLTFESPLNGTAYGTSNDSYLSGTVEATFCPGFGNGNVKNPGGTLKNLGAYFNPAAFNGCTAPLVPFGTATGYGDSGVGSVLGPGQFNWDISILKNTQITERVRMQFRTDFYNAFNHPQFADPGGLSFGSVGFINVVDGPDSISHTNVNPRLIQFGLHFFF
ncbi:MAG: carboxypeptidase-like regulatory domain-containing protein [Candidatus Acidiferrales bacterium]